MPFDHNNPMAIYEMTHRGSALANATIGRDNHNCNLPVYGQVPVSLDPRTKHRAEPGLLVRCSSCDVVWCATTVRRRSSYAPDLVWIQLSWWQKLWYRGAEIIDFNGESYYAHPNVVGLNWHSGHPTKPDGLPYYPIEFTELRGLGAERCRAPHSVRHCPPGGVWTEELVSCLLKEGHEALSNHNAFGYQGIVVVWPVEVARSMV